MDLLNGFTRATLVRIFRFGFVGFSGIGVNLLVTAGARSILPEDGGLSALNAAAVLGTLLSIFSNFVMNDIWTWGDRRQASAAGWWGRIAKYYLSASVGAVLELCVFNVAVYHFGQGSYLWAKLAGIAFATVSNFTLMHFWVFRGNIKKQSTDIKAGPGHILAAQASESSPDTDPSV